MRTQPILIAVTGADGSGKSTVCKNVAHELESLYGLGTVAIVSVWDSVVQSQLFASREAIVRYLNDLDGYTRTLFIFHALNRSIDLALRTKPRVILIDGHWYKYAVSEAGQGVPLEWVLAAGQGFVQPHLVIALTVGVDVAVSRKQEVSEYEQGNTTTGEARERFSQFQEQLHPFWNEVESRTGPWVRIQSDRPPAELAQEVTDLCLAQIEAVHASY